MNVVIDNAVVNVVESGKGNPKTILMLHGWKSDLTTFDTLANELDNKYHVVRLDLPGFGKSDTPNNFVDNPWGVTEYAQFIPKLLDKINAEGLHAIVAHSMGGRIALYGMGKSLFGADRLILIGSHGIKEASSFRNQTFKLIAKSGKILTSPLPKAWQKSLQARLYQKTGSTDYLDAGEMRAAFVKIINQDIREQAGEVEAETLLLYGANDDQTPPAFGEEFKAIMPHAELKIISGAGHFVHTEKPDQIIKLIKAWL